MAFLDFITPILHIVDRIIPDPAQKAAAQLEVLKMQQAGEFKQLEAEMTAMKAQTDINMEEAKNPSIFVSGWRPGAGWTCVVGLGVQFLVAPLATWVAALAGHPIVFPTLDMGTLLALMGGLLGLGGLRTKEKIEGVAAK